MRLFKTNYLISALCCLLSALPLFADYHSTDVRNGGSIRGVVKFATESPPRAMFGTRGDSKCPAGVPQEQLLVNQVNRGIQNVLVILDMDHGKPLERKNRQLDNKGCRFAPRIQWAAKSTTLMLINSDPGVHNVHALRMGTTMFNANVPPGSSSMRRPLLETGMYKINCDRHLWMRAWVYVTDQPYVTVTDAEGRFELNDIPPGSYWLRAWHEGWEEKGTESSGQLIFEPREQSLKVTVRAKQATEVRLDSLMPAIESFLRI